MKNIAFCNVGTQDVFLDGSATADPARQAGKALLEQGDAAGDRLSFPTIKPVLEYVVRQVGTLDHLILIGTDQSDERYRMNDTLYFAQLAAEILVPQFEEIKNVSVERIGSEPEIDPSMYDEAFSAYEEIMHRYLSDDIASAFALPVGGLPACNTALILQCIGHFGERCNVLYYTAGGQPWPLQLGHQVTSVMRKTSAIDLLERFDFAAAISLLSQENQADEVSAALLKYAGSRLNFDFDAARLHLEEAVSKSTGELRQALHQPREDLEKLLAEDQLTRVGELYHNARIAWDNGRYVAYLGRLIRFQEAVLRYLVTNTFRDMNGDMEEALSSIAVRKDIRHFILSSIEMLADRQPAGPKVSADQETLATLRETMTDVFNLSELRDLCFDLAIDYENLAGSTKSDKMRELINHTRRTGHLVELIEACRLRRPNADWGELIETVQGGTGDIRVACAALGRIDQLVPLRNASIIGHGFRGVSKNIILEEYNDADTDVEYNPVQDMALICGVLNIPLVNPFRDVRDLIRRRLMT